jgi:hypothetical protein
VRITLIMTVDNSEFRLVNLTDPALIRTTHENNFAAWGSGLSLEQYFQREKVFASQPATRDGKLTFWALQKYDPAADKWTIVSHMESLTRRAFYKVQGLPVGETVSHGIGSVFTPAQNRGKGYAAIMLKQASEKLDNWNNQSLDAPANDHSFNVLWSDVGDYYSKFDYHVTDTKEIKFSIETIEVAWPEGVTPVGIEDVAALSAQDVKQVRSEIDKATEADGVTRLAIVPEDMVYEPAFRRAQFLAPYLSKSSTKEPPTVFGAKHGGCWIFWTQDFANNKVTCLRMFADNSLSKQQTLESVDLLIRAAISNAAKWNIPAFNLWVQDIPCQLTVEDLSAYFNQTPIKGVTSKIHNRPDSWPMVRYHNGKDPKDQIKWVYDGKYGWF